MRAQGDRPKDIELAEAKAGQEPQARGDRDTVMTGGLWPWGHMWSENELERQCRSSLQLVSTKFYQALFSSTHAVLPTASVILFHNRGN